jgi:integrase
MKRIKNIHYRKFLDEGIIEIVTRDLVLKALENINRIGRLVPQARALLIALYFTGARPNELLRVTGKDVNAKGAHVLIRVQGSKKGLARTVYLSSKDDLVKELFIYSRGMFPDQFLFYSFRGQYLRTFRNKKGEIRQRVEISDKMRYSFKKWFDGVLEGSIPPYYLRHNRFSKLAEKGATMEEIRQLKGSRTFNSIMPYLHMSEDRAKKLSKKIE